DLEARDRKRNCISLGGRGRAQDRASPARPANIRRGSGRHCGASGHGKPCLVPARAVRRRLRPPAGGGRSAARRQGNCSATPSPTPPQGEGTAFRERAIPKAPAAGRTVGGARGGRSAYKGTWA